MEATGLSLGKSVLDGALGYAKSAVAEEVALQLGIQRDHAFIRDELELMLAFLMAAHEERDEHKVVKTWVKQVRDVAYDVEDSLQDFAVRLRKPSWWRILRMLVDRHNVAKQMKELRAKVEDVSQRNVRYHLIKGSSPATVTGQSSITGETMSGIDEARRQKNKAKVDLIRLINNKDENLRVIAIWGSRGLLQETSIVEIAYHDLKRSKKFECHAFSKIMHPFILKEFLQNIVRQFFVDSLEEATPTQQESILVAAQDLRRMGMMKEGDLVEAFKKYVNEKRYLIMLGDLSNIDEWNQIKACFPSNKKGSRLIVCAEQVEVASLCVGPDAIQPEHKQLSVDQTLYAFYEKGSQGGTDATEEGSSSTMSDTVYSNNSTDGKRLGRMETMLAAFKESQLTGRENDKSEIIKMISNTHSQEFEVISICGMGGLGKTLVKYVYQSHELNAMFDKRACVTIKRPFNPNELLSSLATQLSDKKDFGGDTVAGLLEGKRYLIVLDDMSSAAEWDHIVHNFPTTVTTSRIIVTTRQENIAKHCSKKDTNIYKINFLGDKDARNLFTEKVFGNVTQLDNKYPELEKEANLILKKCNGLPLAIVTVGGFLAMQQKTPMEWRKLNEHISAELEMNPELGQIKNILNKSYEGLPYHLKSCFLYLSIFPEDYNIRRRRLVQRWAAEGNSNEVRSKSMEDIADNHFMELIERSMTLPFRESMFSRKGIDSCQIHDLMREISISKSMEENLVFRLEEGCCSNAQGRIRHVAISSNWEGDKSEFESVVDLSHVRSLTVFEKWRSFFISEKMSLLRVLDLEGTSGLLDHHLEHIGRLLHLKYISLRGCDEIYHLPDSWGNLRQLQTLDIKGTRICKLPKTIINLRQLQYLFGGDLVPFCVNADERVPKHFTMLCMACCAPELLRNVEHLNGDPNRHDVCSFWCHVVLPTLTSRRLDPYGIVLPRGIRKLKDLHTLGVVNIASGEGILQDIRRLTQLRKLALIGINQKNCHKVRSTLANLSRLESLSAQSREDSDLHGCLDDLSSSTLKNLQSLKLKGTLVKLPEWIGGLQSLVKLTLNSTKLTEVDATMQVLGKLQNLAVMRLLWDPFKDTTELCLTFHQVAFPSLMCLQLSEVGNLRSVEFVEGATPKLEVLCFLRYYSSGSTNRRFSGLASLPCLKEFVMDNGTYREDFLKDVQDQLAENPNRPVLKRRSYYELMHSRVYNLASCQYP